MSNHKKPLPPKCPPISEALVEYMEYRFPNRLTHISRGDSPRDVGKKIGQASVVEWMRGQHEKQTKNILQE